VNSMREFAILPDEACAVVTENRALLQHPSRHEYRRLKAYDGSLRNCGNGVVLLLRLCIERNLKSGKSSSTRKIKSFMTALRSL
jgi:TetR/AcrR family transcriptional regulator, copper-responsive repressor